MLSFYSDRVLPFDLDAARVAGALSDVARAEGRHPGFADVAIAAIAKSRELVIMTLICATSSRSALIRSIPSNQAELLYPNLAALIAPSRSDLSCVSAELL